jgi:hypothetical protein
MKLSNIKVCTPTDIKSEFYKDTVQDIKNILKLSSFDFLYATVTDEYSITENIIVVIRIGELITFGCEDGLPWIEAYNTPKLFEKMASIGFKSSFFKVEPYKKDKRSKEDSQALNIGFMKAVPKKQVVNKLKN